MSKHQMPTFVYEPQRSFGESRRRPPQWGKGEPSYRCQEGHHGQCTKLSCSCACHEEPDAGS